MIDVKQLVTVLDSVNNCKGRTCHQCMDIYGVEKCPTSLFVNNNAMAIQALERYLDKYGEDLPWELPQEVSEESFIRILTGETL